MGICHTSSVENQDSYHQHEIRHHSPLSSSWPRPSPSQTSDSSLTTSRKRPPRSCNARLLWTNLTARIAVHPPSGTTHQRALLALQPAVSCLEKDSTGSILSPERKS